jgi:hypothetical protein
MVSEVNIEIVRLLRLEPPRAPEGHDRLVHRRHDERDVARPDRERQRPARPEHHLELTERNHGELVLRLAQQRAPFGAHADDPEMYALDLDSLLQRVDIRSKQPIGRLPPDDGDRPCAVDFDRAHQAAALGVEAGEIDVLRRHPEDSRVVEGLVTVRDAPAAIRLGHHRRDEGTVVTLQRPRVLERDARVVADLLEFVVAPRDGNC